MMLLFALELRRRLALLRSDLSTVIPSTPLFFVVLVAVIFPTDSESSNFRNPQNAWSRDSISHSAKESKQMTRPWGSRAVLLYVQCVPVTVVGYKRLNTHQRREPLVCRRVISVRAILCSCESERGPFRWRPSSSHLASFVQDTTRLTSLQPWH